MCQQSWMSEICPKIAGIMTAQQGEKNCLNLIGPIFFICFVYILWLQLTLTHIFASGFQNVCTTRKTSEALVTVPGLDWLHIDRQLCPAFLPSCSAFSACSQSAAAGESEVWVYIAYQCCQWVQYCMSDFLRLCCSVSSFGQWEMGWRQWEAFLVLLLIFLTFVSFIQAGFSSMFVNFCISWVYCVTWYCMYAWRWLLYRLLKLF